MKKIITILIVIVSFVNCKAQQTVNINTFNQGDNSNKYFKDIDNNYDVFLGTWENTTGDYTFRIVLHKTEMKPFGTPVKFYRDRIEGRYQMIKYIGTSNEEIIYNSVKYYPQSGQTSNNVISANSSDGVFLSGAITDNSVDENTLGILEGKLTIRILNTGNSIIQAHWKVEKIMHLVGYEFNIPTDIILTKQ